jgi:hypothetical protein
MSRPASVHDLVQSHRITAVIYAAAKLNLAEPSALAAFEQSRP